MTNDEIKASRVICEKATPGPWGSVQGSDPGVWVNLSEPEPGLVRGKQHLFDVDPFNYEESVEGGSEDYEILAEEQARLDANFCAHARTALPAALDEIERLRNQWRCFNCGFTTSDPKEAEAHFGDMDEGTALCVDWAELDSDGRASAYQDVIRELNKERDCHAALTPEVIKAAIRGIESSCEEFRGRHLTLLSVLKSLKETTDDH